MGLTGALGMHQAQPCYWSQTHSMLERQIILYEWLLCHLQDLLDSIGILSTGHLPPELFPPTVLQNVTANAIEMVHKTHPDYAIAIRHITEYYDMNLAMFGLDSDGSMVVALPVFVKDHASEPKTLYEIEMVKVPIPNKNTEADSYSEVKYGKPYLAINYYIPTLLHSTQNPGVVNVQTD